MGALTWSYAGTQLASTPSVGAHTHIHTHKFTGGCMHTSTHPPVCTTPPAGHKTTEESGIPVPAVTEAFGVPHSPRHHDLEVTVGIQVGDGHAVVELGGIAVVVRRQEAVGDGCKHGLAALGALAQPGQGQQAQRQHPGHLGETYSPSAQEQTLLPHAQAAPLSLHGRCSLFPLATARQPAPHHLSLDPWALSLWCPHARTVLALLTLGTRPYSSELGLSSSPALAAHPTRGTGEAAGGLWGADKAGLRTSSLCPKVPLASKVLASQNVNHCSLGRVRGRRHSLVQGVCLLSHWSSRAREVHRENTGILYQVTPTRLSFPILLEMFLPGSLQGELLPAWPGKASAQGCSHEKMLGGTGDWEERLI